MSKRRQRSTVFRWTKKFIYKLAFDPKSKYYSGLRRILCFPWGLLTGYLFYNSCIRRLDFPIELAQALLPVTLLLYTLLYCLSIQFRTITWLMVPSLASRLGRSYLYLNFFTLCLSNPALNLMGNTYEASRTFMCTITYHRNVTYDTLTFTYEPFIRLIAGLSELSAVTGQRNKTRMAMKDVIRKHVALNSTNREALIGRIESTDKRSGENRAKLISEHYKKETNASKGFNSSDQLVADMTRDLDLTCESVVSDLLEQCLNNAETILKRCKDGMGSWLESQCDKLDTRHECKGVVSKDDRAEARNCKGKAYIPKDLGRGLDSIESTGDQIDSQLNLGKANYRLHGVSDWVNLTSPEAIESELTSAYSENSSLLSSTLTLFNRFLGLLYLLTLYQANSYHNGYRRLIYFDNHYVTGYFRALDRRRVEAGRSNLLPLRRLEKSDLIYPGSLSLSEKERKARTIAILVMVPLIMGALVVISFDYFFYSLLASSANFFTQSKVTRGFHSIYINYEGNSSLVGIFAGILAPKNITYTINSVLTNAQCLPHATFETVSQYPTILLSTLSLLGLAFTQAHLARLKRLICAYFYPYREKRRILYLYNDHLKKRKTYTMYQIRKLRQLVISNAHWRDTPLFRNLVSKKTRTWGWFTFKLKRYCSVCETVEDNGSYQCPKCYVFYCSQCWRLVNQVCQACVEEPTGPPASRHD